jgi:hypothetical protein
VRPCPVVHGLQVLAHIGEFFGAHEEPFKRYAAEARTLQRCGGRCVRAVGRAFGLGVTCAPYVRGISEILRRYGRGQVAERGEGGGGEGARGLRARARGLRPGGAGAARRGGGGPPADEESAGAAGRGTGARR